MKTVALEHLKDRLGEYVRLAAEGETVMVTEGDAVVAQIGPPTPAHRKDWAAAREELIRSGLLTPAQRKYQGRPPGHQGTMKLEDILRDLDESRADRW